MGKNAREHKTNHRTNCGIDEELKRKAEKRSEWRIAENESNMPSFYFYCLIIQEVRLSHYEVAGSILGVSNLEIIPLVRLLYPLIDYCFPQHFFFLPLGIIYCLMCPWTHPTNYIWADLATFSISGILHCRRVCPPVVM